jgi:hypothetical protein
MIMTPRNRMGSLSCKAEEDSTSTLCDTLRTNTYLLDLLQGGGVGLHSDEEGRWMREHTASEE